MKQISLIDKYSKEANNILKNIVLPHLNRPVALFFSGGVDCLWIYAILKELGHNQLRLIHFHPKEIDPSNIRDYQNVLKFIKLTGNSVEFISYPLFDKKIHKQNLKNNNRHYFRTFEQYIINENLFKEKNLLIIRGEDRRIHTPFFRYSDYLAHRRKYGLPYWVNLNRFKGEHILSSVWNRLFASNNSSFIKTKFGKSLNCRDNTYHQIHLAMCEEQEMIQSLEDERIGGLYAKREVLFPFGNNDFIDF